MEVEVLEGETLEGVELAFDDAGAIRGTVERWGKPAGRAQLRASSPQGPGDAGAAAEGVADGEGRFELPRLAPGKYVLSVWTIGSGNGVGARREVTIAQGEVTDLSLDLRSVHVRGRVMESGAPVAAARVEAVPLGGEGAGAFSAVTDGAGAYAMELFGAGPYRFAAGRWTVDVVIPEETREIVLDIGDR